MDQLNQEPIYVMMVTVDKKWQKIEIQREKEVPVRRSAVSARYWRKHLEKTEAEKILREKLGSAEKILVGIGSEWKKKEGAEEEEILHAAEQLKKFLDGKDYYMITSLADEDAKRLPFDAGHIVVPHSVSFTEENWKSYTLWLSCTLNRNTVLLELGENYKDPSLIRWPFEKTAMLNNKAYLFRVHKIFSQVPEELAGKSCPVAEASVKFAEEFFDRCINTTRRKYGCDRK